MELLYLLAVIVILGALLGGRSFGGTIRKGCGFLLLIILVAVLLFYPFNGSGTDDEKISAPTDNKTFVVEEVCITYSRPDIKSSEVGTIEQGEEFVVENPSRFNYFYRINLNDGTSVYVLKECLKVL